MSDALTVVKRPANYSPPDWKQVAGLSQSLLQLRQPVIDRIWEVKKARRGQWDSVIRKIPSSYRKMTPEVDLPEIRDMLLRVANLISGQEPNVEVSPPSGHKADVDKAAKEEARLAALRICIEDQQDRPTYQMGIDAQVSWGESWIMVMPDPTVFDYEEPADGEDASPEGFRRGKDEDAKAYVERASQRMADGRVPIIFEDHDPQTVLPYWSRNRLALCVVNSEHMALDIELGLGYHPVKGQDGKTATWIKSGGTTLSEPFVSGDFGGTSAPVVDTTHAGNTDTGGSKKPQRAVKSTIFLDCWTYQRYLDGILVEEWQHDFGIVPMFSAFGEQTSDRDPAWASQSIIDAPLAVAKQIVMFSAIMASNAMQHGFPTPFLKNPEHGAVHPITGQPLTRQVELGKMNLLGPQEEISFPYLEASMMPDFYRHMDYLVGQLKDSTLSNFGQAIGSDIAGYAVAQIRAMQLSILKSIYTNARRQWRKIFYFCRHIIRKCFPGGIYLRGAVETAEVDGQEVQYRPVIEYAPKHTTDFAIDVHIEEGIAQDKMAEEKMAIEKVNAGLWSKRRAMEKCGVQDPGAEVEEIGVDRLVNSPAADQQVLVMAMAIAAERFQATRTDMSSPFMQELAKAQAKMTGGEGAFQNQGSEPANALPGGEPVQQNPPPATPLEGGPGAGPGTDQGMRLGDMGVPGLPGGVKGGQPLPAMSGV